MLLNNQQESINQNKITIKKIHKNTNMLEPKQNRNLKFKMA